MEHIGGVGLELGTSLVSATRRLVLSYTDDALAKPVFGRSKQR